MSDPGLTAIQNQLPLPLRWLLQGFARHSIVGTGVWLMGHHILPDATAEASFVNWASSGVLILGGLGWSFLNAKAKSDLPTHTTDIGG